MTATGTPLLSAWKSTSFARAHHYLHEDPASVETSGLGRRELS
jgi:hypothetical protein